MGNTRSTNTGDEISKPVPIKADRGRPSRRGVLRMALENLQVGQAITFRTQHERQYVTNIVSAVRKATGANLQTRLVRHRADDPQGKISIEITHLPEDA